MGHAHVEDKGVGWSVIIAQYHYVILPFVREFLNGGESLSMRGYLHQFNVITQTVEGMRVAGTGFGFGEEFGVDRVEHLILSLPAFFVARWQHADIDGLATTDTDGRSGTMGEVENVAFGTAIINAHNDLFAVIAVGHHEHSAHLEVDVGGGEKVLVKNLAVGGFPALEAVVVEGAVMGILRHRICDVNFLRRNCRRKT